MVQYQILVEETDCMFDQYLSNYRRDKSEELRMHNFHILMIRGKLCATVFWVIENEKGGCDAAKIRMYQDSQICS